MKITERDNGTAKLLFMKHERDIFREVGGMSHFLHLPENIEYDTVTQYKAGIGFSFQSFHMGITTAELQCLQRLRGEVGTEVSSSTSHTM